MSEPPRPRLLVVDDEVRILNALQRTLRREGYEVLTADSATDALELLATTSVDLILSDHKMPVMSGIEFCSRASEERPGIPKILITGWTEAVPRERLESLGVQALVAKPWDDGELKQTLRQVLAASRGEG